MDGSRRAVARGLLEQIAWRQDILLGREERAEGLAQELGGGDAEQLDRGAISAAHHAIQVGEHAGVRRKLEEVDAVALVLPVALLLAFERFPHQSESVEREIQGLSRSRIHAARRAGLLDQLADRCDGHRQARMRGRSHR